MGYRRSKDHGNADALSRLPFSNDTSFDGEEMEDDVDSVCLVRTISRQINPDNPLLVVRETAKDPILSQLMRFVKEGWPHAFSEELKDFKKLENSLSTENGCVFYGLRVIIPSTLRNHILKLLHLGHFGMQRMKQLARSTVYWPRIDFDIEDLCRKCTSCGQFQNKPDKPSIHPWMMPEKPWSRLHLDHAINFLGRNWLVLVDAYSKYPCIHPTTSTSSKCTTAILEQEFAHFGYPHTLVTDNATTFMSQEFQAWCKQRGIVHLTGAPYHPATNGAAERLIQSFKQALRKSSLPPKEALQEFLMQYRRIPFASGLSPSELLNGRRIRTKIDTLVPSIPHLLQGRQSRQASKHSNAEDSEVVSKVEHHYSLGDPCCALYFGPRRDRDPRWVPAIVTKVHGTRSVNVRVIPRGPTWRRHLDQLRPRYGSDQDDDPCEIPTSVLSTETLPAGTDHASSSSSMNQRNNPRLPTPLPEDLMRKLGRGYCFSKIDLANAYNQICLSPDSQKKLALSTHKGVLLQKRLPFGIKSAPGYFQEIMEQLTQNLRGVAVYFDDILVSGDNAKDHLMNLRALFKRLEEKGLRCNREKCVFAQVSIDYLGHTLSSRGIAKGSKVDAILEMPTPKNISTLKSFLASVQFYSKFLPPYFSEITEPLYKLTRKGQQWKWGEEEATSFKKIKRLLCTETVLAHYDPSLPLGLSCDASECGIGAVLFHRFADGSERPILNISKVLSATQRRYSQIQKEALSLVYALKKFHQFLYGRKFIVVTDHKPLVTLFAPDKGTPAMAANRLARWALLVHQYDYTVEYRRSKDHGNADALSRLPFSNDTSFDDQREQRDLQKNIVAKMYIYIFFVVVYLGRCCDIVQ